VNSPVLDASAIMAVLNQEVGAERLTPNLLVGACCSSVNVAEVLGKLVEKGIPPDDACDSVTAVVPQILPFSTQNA
jgi:ribonuclease VapC